MRDLFAGVVRVGRFTPATSYQRSAYVCGAILMVSGIVHFGVYLVDGGPWEGPMSWRKPVVFGLSFGTTLVTWSWFMSFLRPRRVAGWVLMGVLSLASVGEVLLVSMQKWRGVESHFSDITAFGSAGALKVPHAFALHAAQVLPALAVLLVSPGAERGRVQIVGLGAVGYATIIASTAVQTYAGRGPLDLTAASTVLAVAGLALVVASVVLAFRGLMLHPPSTPQAG